MEFPKIELHLHLDGAVRLETLLELASEKDVDLEGAKTVDDLSEHLVHSDPIGLKQFLHSFYVFLPVIEGDPAAIERIAYELCQTQARHGVEYFECRYCPQLLCNTNKDVQRRLPEYKVKGDVDEESVVQSVNRGFKRGEGEFGVVARSILAGIRAYPQWTDTVLELAVKYKDQGVVGIDIAGDAHFGSEENIDQPNIHIFEEAKRLGIHRTVHAGESGTADDVRQAIEVLHAERIGHGYRVLQDSHIYKIVKNRRIHLEACPTSSVVTQAVAPGWANHPIIKFAEDGLNFSINTDDPVLFGTDITKELEICQYEMAMSHQQIMQCQLNALESAFLPVDEKNEMIDEFKMMWL